jgi:DNA-binding beta-propeller fold protein YncE
VQTIQLNTFQTNQPTGTGGTTQTQTKLKPQGIATSADGKRVYVVCGSGQVVILEGTTTSQYSATRNVLLAGSVSPINVAVASDSSGDTVYVTDPSANRLFSFNGTQTSQAATVRDISGGPWGVAVGKNPTTGKADRLYVTAFQTNALYPLSLPDLNAATSGGQGLSVEGKEPRGVSVSPIGDEVYVSLAGQNTVEIFYRAGNDLSRPEVFNVSQLNTQYLSPTGDIALGGLLFR